MALSKPAPAQVIRYSYLWHRDAVRGVEEGSKDRPCAIVMMVQNDEGDELVTVLPITHTPPHDPSDAIEIPCETKRRLGLDDDRSWVVVTESNRFCWPGPDLRLARKGDDTSFLYGTLPGSFFKKVRIAFLSKVEAGRQLPLVNRTD